MVRLAGAFASREESPCSLEAKSHDVFLPLYQASHQWADRRKTVHLPMFPGYVFCRFDATARYSVLATSGVIDIVRVGTEPAPIEDSEIEAVQSIVRSEAPAEPYPDIVEGQEMMISGGPDRVGWHPGRDPQRTAPGGLRGDIVPLGHG